MGLSSGEVLEEFEIEHRPEGFQEFFTRIEKHRKKEYCAVAVAMEGYNGYARPLDSMVRPTRCLTPALPLFQAIR